jgi:hypothetical protein
MVRKFVFDRVGLLICSIDNCSLLLNRYDNIGEGY